MSDDLRIAVRLTGDGSALVGELRKGTEAVDKLTASTGAAGKAAVDHGAKVDRERGSIEAITDVERRLVVQQEQLGASLGAVGAKTDQTAAKMTGLGRTIGLNRIGMMELQAAGINSFQALAAGMDPFHVAMMESGQVIGAFVQGGFGLTRFLGLLTNPITLAVAGIATLTAGVLALSGAFDDNKTQAELNQEAQDALKLTLDGQTRSVDELRRAYDRLTPAMQAVQDLALKEAIRTQEEALAGLRRGVDETVSDLEQSLRRMVGLGTRGGAIISSAMDPSIAQAAEQIHDALDAYAQNQDVAQLAVELARVATSSDAASAAVAETVTELIAQAEEADASQRTLARLRTEMRLLQDTATPHVPLHGTPADTADDGTDTRTPPAASPLQKRLDDLQFELSLLGRSQREQEVLTQLRQAGTTATIAQGQGLQDYLATLSAEEQQVAEIALALSEYRQGVDLTTRSQAAQAAAIADIGRRFEALGPAYARNVAAARAWRDATLAALDPAAEGYEAFAAEVDAIYSQELAGAYEEDLANRRDWAAGVERTLRDAADAAGDDASHFADLTRDALAQAEDAWVELAKTGKLSLADLGSYIEDWLLRYSFQQGIQPGLQAGADFLSAGGAAFFSSLFGGSGAAAGGGPGATGGPVLVKHAGGAVDGGGPLRVLPHRLFASAPRFHGGGTVLGPGDVPIVAKAGETVLTAEQFGNASGLVAALAAIATRGTTGAGDAEITLRIVDGQGNKVETQQTRKPGGGLDLSVQLDQLVAGFVNRRGSATRSALEGLGAGAPLRRV